MVSKCIIWMFMLRANVFRYGGSREHKYSWLIFNLPPLTPVHRVLPIHPPTARCWFYSNVSSSQSQLSQALLFTPSLTSFVRHLPFSTKASLSLHIVLHYATFKLHSGCTSRTSGVTPARQGFLRTPASDIWQQQSITLQTSDRKGHRKSFS